MTQEEKTKQHLQRQNKRLCRMIWKLSAPLLVMLLLCVPLVLGALRMANSEPGEAFTVRYSDYYRRMTKGRLYLLETESDGSYRLPWQILENGFRDDVKTGKICPGTVLTVTTRPGLYEDWIATLSTEDRCYGNLDLNREVQAFWIRHYCIAGGILLVIGLVLSGILFAVYRDAFQKASRLRRKYLEKMKSVCTGEM